MLLLPKLQFFTGRPTIHFQGWEALLCGLLRGIVCQEMFCMRETNYRYDSLYLTVILGLIIRHWRRKVHLLWRQTLAQRLLCELSKTDNTLFKHYFWRCVANAASAWSERVSSRTEQTFFVPSALKQDWWPQTVDNLLSWRIPIISDFLPFIFLFKFCHCSLFSEGIQPTARG